MDTINRLLKKQEPKRRKKAADGLDTVDEEDEYKAPSTFVRLVRTIDGPQLMVPESWIEAPAGSFMKKSVGAPRRPIPYTGQMVAEVN